LTVNTKAPQPRNRGFRRKKRCASPNKFPRNADQKPQGADAGAMDMIDMAMGSLSLGK
jgi:hypothetical protein